MATSSDVITTSLPDLSKLKQSYERELKAQMKITKTKKSELQETAEKLGRITQHLHSLTDSRRLTVDKSQELMEEAARLEVDNTACQTQVEAVERQMLEVRELQRAAETSYSDRMNEMRGKITAGRGKYGEVGVVEKRGEELREERERLTRDLGELERQCGDEEAQCEMSLEP